MADSQDLPENQPRNQRQGLCQEVLEALLEALHSPAPDLNERFSLPQRMQVRGARSGPIRHEETGACAAEISVRVGEITRTYVLSIHLERIRAFAVLRDQEGLVEHFDLSDPREPLKEENIQALYEALAVDIASHFGTDS